MLEVIMYNRMYGLHLLEEVLSCERKPRNHRDLRSFTVASKTNYT